MSTSNVTHALADADPAGFLTFEQEADAVMSRARTHRAQLIVRAALVVVLHLPEQQEPLTETAEISVPIEYGDESLIQANVQEAQIAVTVKALAQDERQVPPDLINVPEGVRLTIRPPLTMVRYQVLQDSLPLLNQRGFKVVLDYSKLNAQDSTIVPELVQKPRGIRNIVMWPDRFNVVRQQQEQPQ